MKVNVVFVNDIRNKSAIATMISEDCLFASRPEANVSLRALGAMIDRIETINDQQTIYVKSIDNLLLG